MTNALRTRPIRLDVPEIIETTIANLNAALTEQIRIQRDTLPVRDWLSEHAIVCILAAGAYATLNVWPIGDGDIEKIEDAIDAWTKDREPRLDRAPRHTAGVLTVDELIAQLRGFPRSASVVRDDSEFDAVALDGCQLTDKPIEVLRLPGLGAQVGILAPGVVVIK